jgi:branched-chain amino acid transport system ATP-binding protein
LRYADHGYVLEHGQVASSGPAAELLARDDVNEYYLGTAADKSDVSPQAAVA